jgi:hypothetical protein
MTYLVINSDADIDSPGDTSAQIESYDGNCEVRISNPAAENGSYEEEDEGVTLEWFNSARICVDSEEGRVTLLVSVADPRGAFAMELWKDDDGNIRMNVPHPEDSLLHAPLEERGPGNYMVG